MNNHDEDNKNKNNNNNNDPNNNNHNPNNKATLSKFESCHKIKRNQLLPVRVKCLYYYDIKPTATLRTRV